MFSSVHLEPHHPIIERGFSAFAMSLFVEYRQDAKDAHCGDGPGKEKPVPGVVCSISLGGHFHLLYIPRHTKY